jgi:hypothetical protein
MYMKNLLTILISLVIIGSCSAQEEAGTKRALSFLQEKYGDPGDVDWTTDDNGNLEGQFTSDEVKWRVDFTPEGEWIETEKSIDWNDLPKAVQQAIEEEFDKDDIAELEWVEHSERGQFYDVEFKDSGKNKDVEYEASGKKLIP